MMQPIFSVILVTHKRPDFLNRAVDCVLGQSFQNLELLIYNDAPEDNALIGRLIEEKGDNRIRFTPSSQARGANYWRNQGIRNARGKYIAFLDDDDLWMDSKLFKHYQAHKESNAFMVYSDYIMTWPDDHRPDVVDDNAHITHQLIKAIAKGKFSISTTSSVSVKNEIDGNLFDESLASFQDWDAWFNLILTMPGIRLYRIEEPLLYFTQHNKERVSKNIDRREASLFSLKKKYAERGIDISGFVYKQKLNLLILSLRKNRSTKTEASFSFMKAVISDPEFLLYAYTYKRIGRFMFKNR